MVVKKSPGNYNNRSGFSRNTYDKNPGSSSADTNNYTTKYVKIPKQKVNIPTCLSQESLSNTSWWNLFPVAPASLTSTTNTNSNANRNSTTGNKDQKHYVKVKNMHQATTIMIESSTTTTNSTATAANMNKLRIPLEEGKMVYEYYLERYENRHSTNLSSDDKYVNQILKTGTFGDKISAMTLKISDNPFFNLRTIEHMASLVKKTGDKRISHIVLNAVKDLFVNNLLPSRRLVSWHRRNWTPVMELQNNEEKMVCFALFYYEHCLKEAYMSVIQSLIEGTSDPIDTFKKHCLNCLGYFLENKPEQEALLLASLVNKLGDPDRKSAGYVTELLKKILRIHSAMKNVIAREVQQLIHRPNIQPRALYNGLAFLHQIPLHGGGHHNINLSSSSSTSNQGGVVGKKQGTTSSFVHASDEELAYSLIGTYFDLYEKAVGAGDLGPRIMSALLTGVNRAFPLLSISAAKDVIRNHTDGLFKIVHTSHFAASVQALILIFHIVSMMKQDESEAINKDNTNSKTNTNVETKSSTIQKEQRENGDINVSSLEARFYRALYEKIKELPKVGKPTLFLNLLYKALKLETEITRFNAFSKRLLEVAAASPSLAAGILFLLAEVGKANDIIGKLVKLPSSTTGEANENAIKENEYDYSKREPLYAVSETGVPLWELTGLQHHFHPSVQKFALDFTEGTEFTYKGDPLVDFATMAFLDRFSYKNPKQIKDTMSVHKKKQLLQKQKTSILPNSTDFLQQDLEEISPDQVFYHKFFQQKEKRAEEKETELQAKISARQKVSTTIDGGVLVENLLENDEDENWSDMDEEEAVDRYADKLARSLIVKGHKADFDEEDPDMEGWDDLMMSPTDNGESESESEEDSDDENDDDDDDENLDEIHESNFIEDDSLDGDHDSESDDDDSKTSEDASSSVEGEEEKEQEDEDEEMMQKLFGSQLLTTVSSKDKKKTRTEKLGETLKKDKKRKFESIESEESSSSEKDDDKEETSDDDDDDESMEEEQSTCYDNVEGDDAEIEESTDEEINFEDEQLGELLDSDDDDIEDIKALFQRKSKSAKSQKQSKGKLKNTVTCNPSNFGQPKAKKARRDKSKKGDGPKREIDTDDAAEKSIKNDPHFAQLIKELKQC